MICHFYPVSVVSFQIKGNILFVQQHVHTNSNENNNSSHFWPSMKGNRRWLVDSSHKGLKYGKLLDVTTSPLSFVSALPYTGITLLYFKWCKCHGGHIIKTAAIILSTQQRACVCSTISGYIGYFTGMCPAEQLGVNQYLTRGETLRSLYNTHFIPTPLNMNYPESAINGYSLWVKWFV